MSVPGARPVRSNAIILVADDHDIVRAALRDLLESATFEVAEASNGREALDLLSAGLRPMAILLDVDMPVVDGRSFRSHQLTMSGVRDIPVALMTCFRPDPALMRARMGAVEVWQKPVSAETILRFVAHCLIRRGSPAVGQAAS